MQTTFFVITLIAIAIQIFLRLGIVMGMPLADVVFANSFTNRRGYCVIAIIAYAALIILLLCYVGILPGQHDPTILAILFAALALVCRDVLATVFSRNNKNRLLMGPLNLVLAVSLAVTIFGT